MRGFLVGLVGFLAAFMALLIVANYFGLLSLSPLYHRNKAIPDTEKQTKFICPIKKSPCPLASVISEASISANFVGLGYKDQANGVEVVSIISGKYTQDEATGSGKSQHLVNLNVISEQQNLKIRYLFDGKVSLGKEGAVSKGQVIGSLSGAGRGSKRFGADYNLIIYIQDQKSGGLLQLISSQDGLSIASESAKPSP